VLQSPSPAQVVLQAVAPQTYAPHDCVTRAGQEPVPAQLAAIVSTPPLQEGARHCVAAPGYVQLAAFEPLQAPPQADPSDVHAARVPWGAPDTVLQMPSPPLTSHAWHCPLQALPQQNPSTQNPVAHSPLPPQAVPCDLMNVAAIERAATTFAAT
jgi:hypothetical protein